MQKIIIKKKSENIDFRSKEINNALFNSNKNGEFKYMYEDATLYLKRKYDRMKYICNN